MIWKEPPWLKVVRDIEAREQAMRRQVEAIAAPLAADHLRQYWEREQSRQEQWRRLFEQSRFTDLLASPAKSVANLASAFEGFYTKLAESEATLKTVAQPLYQHQRVYEELAAVTLATSKLATQLDSYVIAHRAFLPVYQKLDVLAASATDVYKSIAQEANRLSTIPLWLVQAPAVQPYSAARALSVLADLPAPTMDPGADAILDDLDAGLEARLRAISPALVEPYRGAITALRIQGPDWPRHVASSLRILVDNLLELLAPDEHVVEFFEQPDHYKESGKFTRRARLVFLFRNVARGSYEKMANHDIDMTLATFFPEHAAVHTLLPALDRRQATVLVRRVQGCIATLLATRERDELRADQES
jgi:hypothetical protein